MYQKIVFEDEQSKYESPATATRNLIRRVHGIEEEKISTIGRRLRSRRPSTHPYAPATPCNRLKPHNCHCNVSTLSNEYIECLSARINRIEDLVKNLCKNTKVTTTENSENRKSFFAPFTILRSDVDFSRMDIDELVSFSNKLGAKLFGDSVISNNQQESEEILHKVNRMDIRAIINNNKEN
ncbi:11759_t:CDS:1 [Acaulospora morrowiae]|uniref:11759_t:CDS:1 n=1 Tax=Acaulospora morrowiae TaxID=94023 RepID=A0A9N8W9Z0_9GLOM|nr:11759_t:CDS:1 [Acaulospora morrowiae]